jgi:hypothetical protein
MTIQERIGSDRGKYKLQQNQQLLSALAQEYPADEPRDQRVKTNVNPQRAKVVGEMVIRHFPELQGFHPQLNEAANTKEFEPLDAFFATLASLRSCYETMQAALNHKGAPPEPVNSKGKR